MANVVYGLESVSEEFYRVGDSDANRAESGVEGWIDFGLVCRHHMMKNASVSASLAKVYTYCLGDAGISLSATSDWILLRGSSPRAGT